MSYIKISDPNIIDLAAWHQVVNVVNQLTDTVNAVSNNTNITGNPDWNATYSHQFDFGSQNITFGRRFIKQGDLTTASESTNHKLLFGSITFASNVGASSFGGTPIVTATVLSGNTGSGVTQPSDANEDAIVTVYNVSGTGFSFRIYKPSGLWNATANLGTQLYMNWIAIGPK